MELWTAQYITSVVMRFITTCPARSNRGNLARARAHGAGFVMDPPNTATCLI